MDEKFRKIPLNPLRVFAVATKHRTFTAAARQMGVSQVAISRQITILENYIGTKLFDRSVREIKLTDAGRSFAHDIGDAFDQLEYATARILSDEKENTINLRLYPTFAHHWLLRRLTEFRKLHPDIRLRLDTTVEPLDFRGTHLDVAIQLGVGSWRDSKSRRLFNEHIDVVCAPDYLDKVGPLKKVADIRNAEILHSKYRRREWEKWSRAHDAGIDAMRGLEFESSLLTYSAAEQGLGLAIGQIDLLQRQLERQDLVQPFQNTALETGAAFYVIWPTLVSPSQGTRRFIDWLLGCAGEAPEFFRQTVKRP